MSDVRLLFRRHGRVLAPLLAVYLVVGVAAVLLRHQAQAVMVFALATVLVSVGAAVYAFDYQFRFFALGEDRLFHLSSASRVRTSLRSSAVLFAYLAGFFVVGRACSLAMAETPYADWLTGLGGGLAQKLASLACGLGIVLLVSAAIKVVRGRLALRGIGWAGAVVATTLGFLVLTRVRRMNFLEE